MVLVAHVAGHLGRSGYPPELGECGRQTRRGGAGTWSGHLGVFRCPEALGRYLASIGRQFSADLHGEVQVGRVAWQLLQAPGDERGGLGSVTTALREPRAQEDEFRNLAASTGSSEWK